MNVLVDGKIFIVFNNSFAFILKGPVVTNESSINTHFYNLHV